MTVHPSVALSRTQSRLEALPPSFWEFRHKTHEVSQKRIKPPQSSLFGSNPGYSRGGGTQLHCLIVFMDKTFQPALHFALKASATSFRWECRLKGDVWNKGCTMLLLLCLEHRGSLKFDSRGLSLQMTCLSFWVSWGHFLTAFLGMNWCCQRCLEQPHQIYPSNHFSLPLCKILQNPLLKQLPWISGASALFAVSGASFTQLQWRLHQGPEKCVTFSQEAYVMAWALLVSRQELQLRLQGSCLPLTPAHAVA